MLNNSNRNSSKAGINSICQHHHHSKKTTFKMASPTELADLLGCFKRYANVNSSDEETEDETDESERDFDEKNAF